MRSVNPPGLIDARRIGYSQAIVGEDDDVYLSGQVGWDENFEIAGEDIESQTIKVLENVEILLESVDRSLDDVRKATCYLVDPEATLEGFLEVWNETFSTEALPCITIVGVASLARPEFLVEIDVEV